MIYIFTGQPYNKVYEKALHFAQQLVGDIFIINKERINYGDKDEVIAILKSLSFIPDNDKKIIMVIESIEQMSVAALQYMLPVFDNLLPNQYVIFITDAVYQIPQSLLSRSIIELIDLPTYDYQQFIESFLENKNFFEIENILERFHITAYNTKELILLLQSQRAIKNDFIAEKLIHYYLSYIPHMYINYWQFIFLLIN